MAIKDHSLDQKIIDSARKEFISNGYTKASLHKIAENAGITTGALYTRYKGKDDLFYNLLKNILSVIYKKSETMKNKYLSAMNSGDPEEILKVIKEEEKIYIDMLFENYEDCILLFCKSDGSSIQAKISEMTEFKAKSTIQYLKSISKKEANLEGIEFIMSEQFKIFRSILEKGCDKEKAAKAVEGIEAFYEAGWKDLFKKIM